MKLRTISTFNNIIILRKLYSNEQAYSVIDTYGGALNIRYNRLLDRIVAEGLGVLNGRFHLCWNAVSK